MYTDIILLNLLIKSLHTVLTLIFIKHVNQWINPKQWWRHRAMALRV